MNWSRSVLPPQVFGLALVVKISHIITPNWCSPTQQCYLSSHQTSYISNITWKALFCNWYWGVNMMKQKNKQQIHVVFLATQAISTHPYHKLITLIPITNYYPSLYPPNSSPSPPSPPPSFLLSHSLDIQKKQSYHTLYHPILTTKSSLTC